MHSAADLLTRWPTLDVAARRARLHTSFQLSPGPIADRVRSDADRAARAASLLWRHQPSAWSDDAAVQKTIANRLGWLDSPALMAGSLDRLHDFAERIKNDGFTDVVLLGMGGSSLAPEVLRAIVGVSTGWPRFHMLDSTDPSAIRAVATDPARTLYIVASKSGTTIEPNTLEAHFEAVLGGSGVANPSSRFVAITDDGTELARRAARFRDFFVNPSDIGGRYSALSFFGMVPAALMGQDLAGLIGWGLAMLSAAEPEQSRVEANPAVALGLAIGAAARSGRDKLTLVVPDRFAAFGLWVEQLIAESTGKQGTGVVPIAGEPIGDPSRYGSDRFFVVLRPEDASAAELRAIDASALEAAGHPVARIDVAEPAALGAEFVRWEIATAIAGALLGINPFDEPNVKQAKDATTALLETFESQGKLPERPADRQIADGITLTASRAAREALGSRGPDALLSLIGRGDYSALLAYVSPADATMGAALRGLRSAIRDRTRAATMFGYGPRYLHSTGQLHKGGPNTGVFIVVTATPREDVPIPGRAFSFATLEQAQALGDFASLDTAGRRAIHAHLPSPDARLVRSLGDALLAGA